ncbi:hypothetical protein [Burkholderia mayonis]|uniref:Uncharacterized protein n=1 Tax=Burkholderia mayonis TaxID=1385591 RepID=A0A1B4FVG7_9BURK|nr:hypothetical protein [Burkholderia mayonis]AOJ07614.1 hypothetical protein WS71_10030 [Burkholderia mayonis]KVE58336.1 hypothetical protein WS71_24625 [Burkholderia mayonis]
MTNANDKCAVTIEASPVGTGRVLIDGVEVRCVQSVNARIRAGQGTVVELGLVARGGTQIHYEGASLYVEETAMPAALEIALWKHLAKKYGRDIDVTTMSSSARDYCIVGD